MQGDDDAEGPWAGLDYVLSAPIRIKKVLLASIETLGELGPAGQGGGRVLLVGQREMG